MTRRFINLASPWVGMYNWSRLRGCKIVCPLSQLLEQLMPFRQWIWTCGFGAIVHPDGLVIAEHHIADVSKATILPNVHEF